MGPVGIASYLSEVLHPGPTVVDGTTVTLAIPIRTVIWDGFLTLLVHTPGSGEGEPWADEVGQDRFPNDDNACFPVIVPAS